MKKFKELLLSPLGVLLIPIIIILFVLFSNVDVLLDRMGFETRAHLKSELAKARYTLSILQDDLAELRVRQKKIINQCLIKEEIVNEYVRESEGVDDYIKDIINNNKVPQTHIKKDDGSEQPVPPKQDINLNNDNIVAIHNVYNELFGS